MIEIERIELVLARVSVVCNKTEYNACWNLSFVKTVLIVAATTIRYGEDFLNHAINGNDNISSF